MSRITFQSTPWVLALFSAPAFPQQPGPYYHDHMWGSGGMFMGSFLFLIVIAAVIFFAIYLIRQTHDNKQSTRQDPSVTENPVDILKVRYAKGEIDHEEFEQRKKMLEQ